MDLRKAEVLVVGAGIMGSGIAQVAAQAGHRVWLHDAREGAAAAAKAKLAKTLDSLVAKGRVDADAASATLARITPAATLADAAGASLAIEAIVEDLQAKQALLRQLEALLSPGAVLASNTSSISITALAGGLAHPARLVGMHFFNPVPLMKLVEVVSGLHSDAGVAQAVADLAGTWGKVAVHAQSTPGFIVNRIARPFYAETWALLLERAASPAVIDACLRAAGFRMGPCELMDLIGHDTNFAVTMSVYEANFFDKRYQPSLLQREMVAGGLLGRKSGRGFYAHGEGAEREPLPVTVDASALSPVPGSDVTVHGRGALAEFLAKATAGLLGSAPARAPASDWTGLALDTAQGPARLMLTEGRCADAVAAACGCADVALFDRWWQTTPAPGQALAWTVAAGAGAAWRSQAPAWLAALGFTPLPLADTPGLVVARTLAMLINEAADAVLQGVCDEAAADAAMKLGLNYPAGPFEWLAGWDAAAVVALLDALDAHYRGERYRVSPWLRRRAVHGAAQPLAGSAPTKPAG
jgi:3-hydroxybutyryl-CoA dehydrogenase